MDVNHITVNSVSFVWIKLKGSLTEAVTESTDYLKNLSVIVEDHDEDFSMKWTSSDNQLKNITLILQSLLKPEGSSTCRTYDNKAHVWWNDCMMEWWYESWHVLLQGGRQIRQIGGRVFLTIIFTYLPPKKFKSGLKKTLPPHLLHVCSIATICFFP